MSDGTTYFAVWARDRPGMLEERRRVRETHRARLREGAPGVRVVLGGPTTDEAGDMAGSLLVIESPDIERVRAFVAGDPYVEAGVYDPASIQILAWRRGIGRPAWRAATRSGRGMRIVHLVARDAHVAERLLDAQVLGVHRISVERRLVRELGVEHDVAGVVDLARVDAHLEVIQARYRADEALETALEDIGAHAPFLRRFA